VLPQVSSYSRAHASAACVLLFRVVRDVRDQAQQLRLIPAVARPQLMNETVK